MIYILERIVPPDEEIVSLAELKRHLRTFASDTSEDDDFSVHIQAAREWVEGYTGRALATQQWRITITSDPVVQGDTVAGTSVLNIPGRSYYGQLILPITGEIFLRRSPVQTVDKFVSVDSLGNEVDMPSNGFELREKDSRWPRLAPLNGSTWMLGTYRAEFTAGFSDLDLVPACFRQAIKLLAEKQYDRDPAMMDKLQEAAEYVVRHERADWAMA
jgi:hypothetical protein